MKQTQDITNIPIGNLTRNEAGFWGYELIRFDSPEGCDWGYIDDSGTIYLCA